MPPHWTNSITDVSLGVIVVVVVVLVEVVIVVVVEQLFIMLPFKLNNIYVLINKK